MFRICFAFALITCAAALRADGPADNNPDTVRRLPKLGIEVPAEKRAELEAELKALRAEIDRALNFARTARNGAYLASLLPDVEIYYKAVHDALKYQEFFAANELGVATELLKEGRQRAMELAEGKPSWPTQRGLVVKGYVSRIDGSVQPYGLVIPDSWTTAGPHKYRLDFWFHGRGETMSELSFIQGRRKSIGQFAPPDTIVLHPYGRWNNANKFAGETDGFEALDNVQKHYRIDEDRISVRGFSMGGAAAWHFAVHHADRWFAANPGAGFSETPDFLDKFQKETLNPTWWEKKLWHLYDCTDYAANLYNLPTVAYSGEKDNQKQAADIMAAALAKEGMTLTHIIGANEGHKYTKEAAAEVERRVNSLASKGRNLLAFRPQMVTYTLKYNRMNWITIDEMEHHWERARVTTNWAGSEDDGTMEHLELKVENVTALTIDVPAGDWPLYRLSNKVLLSINKHEIKGLTIGTDHSFRASVYKDGTTWKLGPRPSEEGVTRKRHNLQGPVDDAFMDSFIFVRPTGKARHELVEKWTHSEMDRAIEHWRRHFRGEARVKDDTAITDADIAGANLVLWGDPASNAILKRIEAKLPIRWPGDEGAKIDLGEPKFSVENHALILIAPNPLNTNRYVVLNSGFTFRDYAHLNNARQVPMLPDWAVVDLRTPPGYVWPGKVVNAGFFDEKWRLQVLKK